LLLDSLHECKYKMQMLREQVSSPPVGFRPSIPVTVKLDVVIRQGGVCGHCTQKLGSLADTEFDHVPALGLRGWDEKARNTIPAANDPQAIVAKHKDCHLIKTTGRKGESRLGDNRDGDTTSIARLRRLTRKETAFRERMLRKVDPEVDTSLSPETTKKSRWPKRSFPKRKVNEPRSPLDQERS
jgi:hypothetical protein